MTTANHTAILATKVAANAATFNSPLGELDAAMGAVSTLTLDGTTIVSGIGTAAPTTTAQTLVGAINELDAEVGVVSTLTLDGTTIVSGIGTAAPTTTAKTLVGAINELDAQIGTAASVSGSIGATIETDGTLKRSALDPHLPSPNLCYDPFNAAYYNAPSIATIDGKRRWKSADGTRKADAAAFSGYVIELTTTLGNGKWLDIAEMGLVVGDVVSGGVSIYVPTGRSVKVGITCRGAAPGYAAIANYTSSAQAGGDAWYFVPIHNITIDAATVVIDLYVINDSGTGTCKVRAWYLNRGSYAYALSAAPSLQDGITANSWLLNGTYLPHPNLAPDPLNRRLNITTDNLDGRLRLYAPSSDMTKVEYDSDNPYGTPTIRITGTGHGRRFWLDEMGLRPGDVISVGVLAKVATGTATQFGMYQYDATGSVIVGATMYTATITGADATAVYAMRMADETAAVAMTLQAAAVSFAVYTLNYVKSSGTGYVDIYAWFVALGNGLSSAAPLTVAPEGRPYEQLIDYPPSQVAYGRHLLPTYTARAAQNLQTATPRTISAATNAAPIEITTTGNHLYKTWNRVRIASVGGNTAANGDWTVTYVSATKFTLNGSTGNGEWTSGGTSTQLLPVRVAILGDSWVDGAYRLSDLLAASVATGTTHTLSSGYLAFI